MTIIDKPVTESLATQIDSLVKAAQVALLDYANFTQEQIDHIVKKASVAALSKHAELAVHAVAETGRGVFEDKAVKNLFACEHVTNSMQNLKTVGVISRDDITGITEIAEPVGVICGVTPVTNPTSTAIFKSLIALKTRNPIVFGFHPGAQQSSVAAARVVRDAAILAGAPANCIQWVETPSLEATSLLMNHPGVATILATGGNAMVRAAYSCGKPALGVGAGNVPAFIEKSAKLKRAINDVVLSKSFDYGMICASEQAVIIEEPLYAEAMAEFKILHTYLVTPAEKLLLEDYIFGVQANSTNCGEAKLNAAVVGKSPVWIAQQAGFTIPADTSIILVEVAGVGPHEPMTREKLAPVLAVLHAKDAEEGISLSEQMVEFDGLGHSGSIHSENPAIIEEFGTRVKAVRIITNAPSSLGGIGDIYNAFIPSLTLGCGSYGHNSVSNNVSAINLINVKRIGRRNNNLQWFKVPAKTYFEPNAIRYLADMRNVERVTIVTDSTMTRLGFVDKILDILNRREGRVALQIIDNVLPEPTVSAVEKGAAEMRAFKPDTIIALGGGSPMDAAKVMWLLYEHPEIEFSDMKEKFFDVRKRAFKFPDLGELAKLVCIPTTSGTGSEMTPFAVITDEVTGVKYPLADYALLPTVAIIDPVLTAMMPSFLVADSGFDALTHATEAYVSVYANDFTDGLCLHAIKLIFENIVTSVNGTTASTDGEVIKAREKMHNASSIAGMAFGNAFLGICHAMAHVTGAQLHLIHGRVNATYLPHVIRYNGLIPTKLTSWPKYESYIAPERFQQIAKHLGLPASTPAEGVESYALAVEKLRDLAGIKPSFQAQGVPEEDFISRLDSLAMGAYGDQCAPANPRMPMLDDMRTIMEAAYYGTSFNEVRAGRAAVEAVAPAEEKKSARKAGK
ncbi:bifunctional acetaldehyde-CoA/alcohol dehydrogenase [Cryobacterium sp. TMT2-18-3]|uniref:bifunctional acetaldehyde-CoA/alcohol dehydrogenase n=1 Tax=unclassified Cryobacterium TaxID=2649013 RepID=UPI00106A1BD5|nr:MULTISPECIES: bifunctional acetaldehyde-CoA/alcohol dehydrogenase [unclassified Cryobacterium]TFC32178.1 bifunctional acetaldehyde-CoA/alcohol dehydrogenase [Cryobacterium sp. TMT2-18-2]TFC38606.1 bifunctional acetaldehyde-CoA/alcohol dehydrogenase [Cryobacterium sp. TMT2-42-4]TFC56314.1 bifunctional acetaldehyde-CoA/alcohol dehydrogenase [Cryobacterium sp. TMT2-15-1]TFC66161.1 bifunctional acetaldehyde-CoA/alcohol dehydrogenase [Cryobacterium sp. TMT2-18-3]